LNKDTLIVFVINELV